MQPQVIMKPDDIGFTRPRKYRECEYLYDFVLHSEAHPPEEPHSVYHISPAENFASIRQIGLRPAEPSDISKWNGGAKTLGNEPRRAGRLYAAADLHTIANLILELDQARPNLKHRLQLHLFRMQQEYLGWRRSRERHKSNEVYRHRRVKPEKIDIWTDEGWRPLVSVEL